MEMEHPVIISNKGKIFSKQNFFGPIRKSLDYHNIARRWKDSLVTYDKEIDTSAVEISGNNDI